MDKKETKNVMGVVTSRQCPECGHHEVGFTTEDGVFHPLRPGTIIQTGDPSVPSGIQIPEPLGSRAIPEEEGLEAEITQKVIFTNPFDVS